MSERRGKYNAVKTEIDGRVFASKAEARRYSELCILESAGEIFGLECQPKFQIFVNKVHVCNYLGDFRYRDKSGETVVEDVKSEMTRKLPVYRLKIKLLEVTHGVKIKEVL